VPFSEEIDGVLFWTGGHNSFGEEIDSVFGFIPGHVFGEEIDAVFGWEGFVAASVFDAAATAPAVLGAVRGPQIADVTLAETHLKPITALRRRLSRMMGPGPELAITVPAGQPVDEEAITWLAAATAGGSGGVLTVSLGDKALHQVTLTAGQTYIARGVLLGFDTLSETLTTLELIVSEAYGLAHGGGPATALRLVFDRPAASQQLTAEVSGVGSNMLRLSADFAGRVT
jgi:hypothetical protein